jgi:hypothetical protein
VDATLDYSQIVESDGADADFNGMIVRRSQLHVRDARKVKGAYLTFDPLSILSDQDKAVALSLEDLQKYFIYSGDTVDKASKNVWMDAGAKPITYRPTIGRATATEALAETLIEQSRQRAVRAIATGGIAILIITMAVFAANVRPMKKSVQTRVGETSISGK